MAEEAEGEACLVVEAVVHLLQHLPEAVTGAVAVVLLRRSPPVVMAAVEEEVSPLLVVAEEARRPSRAPRR